MVAKKRKTARKAKKKVVFIVVDGLADTQKSGKTPLSEAKKPNIDWLAANGACGELTLITKSMWKKINTKGVSQYANVNLLGYTASRYPLDRGPLEAVGSGVPYKEGHLAVRCNFATVDRNMVVKDRRSGRNTYGLDEIARRINKNVKIGANYLFMRTYGHRAVLIIKKRLSANIRGNDVGVDEVVKRIEPLDSKAEESAKLVQEFIDKSRNVIHFHQKNSERIDLGIPPANYILARQAGNKLFALPNFAKRWKIKNAVCIAENGVMKATCMLAGFNSINVPEFDNHNDWLDFIFENIDAALAEYDFVYAHIKGADEAAHDKDPSRKRKIIEEIDARLESYKDFDGIVVLTCDHITSSKSGNHEYGEVPVVAYGRKKDAVKKFDERTVKKGSLKKMSGRELMKFIFGR
jgi:2,3-bisphosphoglycerate-independent phosphoglycerate mutase